VINPWKHPIDRTTPQHIIESRTLYIQWRKEVLARQPADWPYRQATIAEIQDCEREIAAAHRAASLRPSAEGESPASEGGR